MKHLLPLFCALFVAQHYAPAQAPATIVTFESAKLTAGDALPGSNAIVTVSFKIEAGYYLHSNRPILRGAMATQVQVGTLGATRALPGAFSNPGQKTIPGNAVPVQVYEGGLTVTVPVVIAANAACTCSNSALGPATSIEPCALRAAAGPMKTGQCR